jgi:hypothetical protein
MRREGRIGRERGGILGVKKKKGRKERDIHTPKRITNQLQLPLQHPFISSIPHLPLSLSLSHHLYPPRPNQIRQDQTKPNIRDQIKAQ